MKTIKVSDMRCIHCKERIEKGLKEANIEATIDLENKRVSVADEKLAEAIDVIDDLGFDAKEEN